MEFNEYKVNQENFNKIDKFFKTDKRLRKPFFMDMEKMYSELPQMHQIGVGLRDLVFDDYNINSQVTHGQYYVWTRGLYTDNSFIDKVKSQLAKIVTYPLYYLKGQVNIDLKKLARLKQITDQLIINIYKHQ